MVSFVSRSRWAAIGAAVAVSLGAGGGIGFFVHADSAPSSFVTITPCRLFDTRTEAPIGDRATPLVTGETFTRQVTGTNGSCTIPAAATGIQFNLTLPAPPVSSFVKVFPGDVAAPNASVINAVGGQGVRANGGVTGLSATGSIKLFVQNGPLNAVMDITGYYLPASAGPAGPAGPRGFSAWDVIPSGQTVSGSIVWDTHGSSSTASDAIGIDLPGRAPVALTSQTVNFSANSGAVGDGDASCTGSAGVPTAPTGKVCIYLTGTGGITESTITGQVGLSMPTRSFLIEFNPVGSDNQDEYIYATWAYTAP